MAEIANPQDRTIGIDDAREHGIPLPVPEKSQASTTPAPARSRKKAKPQEKFTLDQAINEAFMYEQCTGNTRDLQKTLLAAAFILDKESDYGSKDVNGPIASGLAELVRNCAKNLREYCQSKNPDVLVENGEIVAAVDGQYRTIRKVETR